MCQLTELNRQLAEAEAELEDAYSMSEEAVCFRYNVEDKDTAITLINEEIEALHRRIEEAEKIEARDQPRPYHFAFPTEASYWAYRY